MNQYPEARLLGKRVDYPQSYSPEILVAVPRRLNREIYGINEPEQLFCGFDAWHAYEAGFLLDNGMPVAGLLKIVYPATSPDIIESKSLKLYLGSYNMTPMGPNREEGAANFIRQIKQDLSRILSTDVEVSFYTTQPEEMSFDFEGYETLEEILPPEQAEFTVYRERPEYLAENVCTSSTEIKVCSHLLKSNCKITGQPDWGSIYIHLKGPRVPDRVSLLKYIVSLRNENHFHEEICEMTYKRLRDLFDPQILMVSCLYTRRGGIDICPCRASAPRYLPALLPQSHRLTRRSFRQ